MNRTVRILLAVLAVAVVVVGTNASPSPAHASLCNAPEAGQWRVSSKSSLLTGLELAPNCGGQPEWAMQAWSGYAQNQTTWVEEPWGWVGAKRTSGYIFGKYDYTYKTNSIWAKMSSNKPGYLYVVFQQYRKSNGTWTTEYLNFYRVK